MPHVEHCKKHGQYHGEVCGECFYENGTDVLLLTEQVTSLVYENLNLHEENTRLKDSIAVVYLENARLEAENKLFREALTRIEKECYRHDTTAWGIASDVLEEK